MAGAALHHRRTRPHRLRRRHGAIQVRPGRSARMAREALWPRDTNQLDLGSRASSWDALKRALQRPEAAANFIDNFFGRSANVHHDGVAWFLEVSELAGKDVLVGEVAFARAKTFSNQLVAAFQIDKSDFQAAPALLPVAPL